jgi:Domain of unknown function (DUF4365)
MSAITAVRPCDSGLWLGSPVPQGPVFPTVHRSGAPYGRLFETNCREQISIAYAQAVVTAARCKLEHVRVDDEKVDAVVRQEADHPLYDGASIDLQLKCTSQDVVKNGFISWSLSKAHYDKLRNPKRIYPRILVLMLVPEDFESWVVQDHDNLRLVKCAYWIDLVNAPDITADSTTIKIPVDQVFNVEQLLRILQVFGAGEV